PFTRDRFHTALDRVRDRIARRTPDAALEALAGTLRGRRKYRSRVTVKSSGRTHVIDLASVDWIQAADNYVRLHVQSREYLLRETLASFEAELDPARFVRIHRSVIVPIDRVATLVPASHGDAEVVLRDGTHLAASRTWRDRLRRV